MRDLLGKWGHSAGLFFANVTRLSSFSAQFITILITSPFKKKSLNVKHVFRHMVLMGVDSVSIACLVGLTVGAVLALQSAYQLKQFGAVSFTGSLVSISIVRELGPLVASIVITGRVGARIAAELGTMTVQEEVDALSTMGLHPMRYLVAPRCIALILMLPCLTMIADAMGILGGFLVGTFGIGINPHVYILKTFNALAVMDISMGLVKSFLFAFVIAIVSCYQGLAVKGGAEGVGKATTQAVVLSIVLIIVVDCLATAVMFYTIPG